MDAATQITQLQEEIAMRGRIIQALVNGNEEIRHNYARAVSFIRSKADTYSPGEKEMLQKMLGSLFDDSGKGITEQDLPISENSNGITKSSYSIDENRKGITKDNLSIDEKEKGITNVNYSFDENGKGITSPGYSLSGKIEQEKLSVSALHHQIRQHNSHKAKRSASWATTDLLIHIYNGGNCGYPTLKKVTKLSTGGLGKMLMRLTKRGLIKRTGLQKLELTGSALNLLEKACTASTK